jgi:ABC-type lipoprotein release transport system permease subunit
MNLFRIIIKEIRHSKGTFIMGVAAVTVSVLSYIVSLSILSNAEASFRNKMQVMSNDLKKEITELENGIRKSMKGLGFNIHIYPENQDLAVIYEQGYGEQTMPEEYVETLANSKIVTVNHLLPRLTQMVKWEEKDQSVLLIGVRGEVPIAFRGENRKKALIDPVEKGNIVLGYELHNKHELDTGDIVTFMGKEFKVTATHPSRGTVDDITAWMSLSTVQELLKKPSLINGILALECNCESIDRLGEIKKEIGQILPNTKIIEKESKALARAEARNKVKMAGEKQIQNFAMSQKELILNQSITATLFVLIIAALSIGWITYLTFSNVANRSVEIGILGAIGFGGSKLILLIISRAMLMGVIGTVCAFALSFALVPTIWGTTIFVSIFTDPVNLLVLTCAPALLSCSAAWVPAVKGSLKDPALILRNE